MDGHFDGLKAIEQLSKVSLVAIDSSYDLGNEVLVLLFAALFLPTPTFKAIILSL